MIYAVIGSGYGDEGKGLVTDYLSSQKGKNIVIRHNGGAQSGHTVEIDTQRFVFHELSSGSFRHADTLWAETFLPDMYKLKQEIEQFQQIAGFIPNIFVSPRTNITTISDIFVNMLIEQSRGEDKHGSCGMGINEADLRIKAGFGISFNELAYQSPEMLFYRLKHIRENYYLARFNNHSIDYNSELYQMYQNDNILYNYAVAVLENLSYVKIIDLNESFLLQYDNMIFENGQGLKLDAEYAPSFPHVTASRTGRTNIVRFLNQYNLELNQVFYVTRSYVTKHGAGPLHNEITGCQFNDLTNIHNDWQGSIRYAKWNNIHELLDPIEQDIKLSKTKNVLVVTHLNETDGKMLFADSSVDIKTFIEAPNVKSLFDSYCVSYSKFSKDIQKANPQT